jgi:hypothetical protein
MVQLTISSANAAAVCPDTSFTVTVGVPDVFLSLRCSDADFDELTYEVTDAPDHGTLLPTQEPGVWEFEPEADYAGPDGFTVRVSDGDTSVVVPVDGTIEARPTPAPPVCPNLSLTTPPGRELRVPLDCLDPLGRHGLPEIVEPPSAATGSLGIISLNPYSVLFTPAPGFVGVTRFTYRSTTPWAVSAPATIEIRVRDAPPPGTSGGEAPAPPTQAQAVPAADVAPPALALAIPSRLAAAKSLAFDLTLSEPAALAVKLTVSRATARRLKLARRTLGTATRAAAAGSTRVRVKLGTQARRALTRSKRPVKVKVAAVAIDAAGNRRALSRNVTVRRR